MRFQMLIAAFVATTAASDAAPQDRREALEPRATVSLPDVPKKCSTEVMDLLGSVPTPPVDIITKILGDPPSDLCSFSTDASLSKDYSSFSNKVVSWLSSNSDEVSSIYSNCPAVSSYASMLSGCNTLFTPLVQGPNSNAASTTGTGMTSTTGTADSGTNAAGSDEATTTSPNVAPRETGMAMAALAAAGLAAVAL